MSQSQSISQLLTNASAGNQDAANDLMSQLYDELRRLAGHFCGQQPADNSLQPTLLVHEAYLKLVNHQNVTGNDRTHFFNTAALAMRQVLADHARRRRAAKRGGDWARVELGAIRSGASVVDVDVVDLEDALTELAELDERQVRIVELRFLAGMTVKESAAVLGVSSRTVENDWRMARAWLRRRLGGEDSQ